MSVYQPANGDLHEAVSAWFLGPQAENFDLLRDLFNRALDGQAAVRKSFHPEDGVCCSFFYVFATQC